MTSRFSNRLVSSRWSLIGLALASALVASPAHATFTFTVDQHIHFGSSSDVYIKVHCAVTNTGASPDSFRIHRALNMPAGWTNSICVGGVGGNCYPPSTSHIDRWISPGQTDSISLYFTPNDGGSNVYEGSGYGSLTVDEVLDPIPADQTQTLGAVTDGVGVLFVDDDGGGATETFYQTALGNVGQVTGTWRRDLASLESVPSTIRAVVWATGASTNTLDASDRQVLSDYLAGGGRVLLSGQDIANDLDNPASSNYSAASKTFFESTTHSTWVQDNSASLALNAVPGEPVSQGLALAISGGTGANNQTDPDVIAASTGSHALWTYGTGGTGAVRAWTGSNRVVFLGFGLEAIAAQVDRDSVMSRSLGWLENDPVVAVDPPAPRTGMLTLEPPRPNPSHGHVAFTFSMPASGPVALHVIDVTGRTVFTMKQAFLAAGAHAMEWNGRDQHGQAVGSGLYFLRLQSNDQVATRRVVLTND